MVVYAVTNHQVEHIRKRRAEGATFVVIAKEMGISKSAARYHGVEFPCPRQSFGTDPIKPVKVLGVCPVKRCGTRIFDDGRPHECVPGAVAFLGRRGEQECGTDTGRRR